MALATHTSVFIAVHLIKPKRCEELRGPELDEGVKETRYDKCVHTHAQITCAYKKHTTHIAYTETHMVCMHAHTDAYTIGSYSATKKNK